MTTPLPSPCIRHCTLALGPGAVDVCIGCLRTLSEITEWAGASPTRQQAILDALPARRGWFARPG